MKVRKRLILPMVVLQLVAIISPLLVSEPAQAAAQSFKSALYVFPTDNGKVSTSSDPASHYVEDINSALGNNDNGYSALDKTAIDLKGGVFGNTPYEFDFNKGFDSGGYASANSGTGGIGYTNEYNCYVSNGQASLTPAGGTAGQAHWNVSLNVIVTKTGKSVADANALEAAERIDQVNYIPATQSGGQTSANQSGTIKESGLDPGSEYAGLTQSQITSNHSSDGPYTAMPSGCLPANYSNHRNFQENTLTTNNTKGVDLSQWPGVTAGQGVNGNGSGGPKGGSVSSGSSSGSGSGSGAGTSGAVDDNTCESQTSSGALGWILCPVIDIADSAIGSIISNVIIPSLTVCPLAEPTQSVSDTNCSTSGNSADYQIWQNFRNLADVVFLIAFLVIIFANVLQFNIETYTVKKMLPKLVAAVILVQFSYILSAVIVDLGNVLGAGVEGLANVTLTNATGASGAVSIASGGTGSGLSPLETGISLGLATGVLLLIGVPTLMGIALAGIIGAIGVLVTLVTRKLIIILLAVTSPIALACWVLPNTEKVFKLWLQNFIKISLMFPIIVLILSLASVGSYAVQGTTNGLENVMGALLPIIAFFMIPMTFKWAGQAMNFASGQISGLTKKTQSGADNKLKNSRPMKAWAERRAAKKGELTARLATEGTGEGEQMPKVLGSRKLGRVRQGAVSRWATGSLTGRGEYVAKQREALAHQAEQARQELYAGTSMDELAKVVGKDETSLQDRVAIAKMAAKLGGYDDERFQDAIWKGVGLDKDPTNDAKLAQFRKLVEEVKSVNYGGIKKDSIVMQTFDTEKGDRIAEDGAVEMGAENAIGLSAKGGDRILNQTGTGLKTLNKARVNASTVDDILKQVDAGEVTLEADVVTRLRTAQSGGQGMAAKDMISNAVKVAAAQSPLRTKWHGEASEVLGSLATYSGAGGGSQENSQDDLGVVDSTNPAASEDTTSEEGLGGS